MMRRHCFLLKVHRKPRRNTDQTMWAPLMKRRRKLNPTICLVFFPHPMTSLLLKDHQCHLLCHSKQTPGGKVHGNDPGWFRDANRRAVHLLGALPCSFLQKQGILVAVSVPPPTTRMAPSSLLFLHLPLWALWGSSSQGLSSPLTLEGDYMIAGLFPIHRKNIIQSQKSKPEVDVCKR